MSVHVDFYVQYIEEARLRIAKDFGISQKIWRKEKLQ